MTMISKNDHRWGLVALCWLMALPSLAQDADPTPTFTRTEPVGAVIVARPGDTPVLSMADCVSEALKTNDALTAERLRMQELDGQMDQALSTGLPTLDLVGNWRRGRDPSFALDSTLGGGGGFAPPEGAPPWFNDWISGFGSIIPDIEDIGAQSFLTTNLNLHWELNPIKISGAVGAAKQGIQRQNLLIESVENSTEERVFSAYYSIIKAAEKIQAVRAQLANQTEFLTIMQMRYELGLATKLDTMQAAVTLANVRPQLSLAESNLRNEGARLNAVMGRSAEASLQIANTQIIERDQLIDNQALELAWERPDLAATDVFTDILRSNRKAQKSELYPYLSFNGAYGYVGKHVDTMFDAGHDSWSAAVALNIPVFDGMLNRGLIRQTDAQIRRTEAELTGQRRFVQVEVLEILANLRMAREVLDAVTLNLARSEEVLEESLLMLQLGKINYVDVLLAEANRAEAQSNVIDARYTVLTLTSSLKRAVGYSSLTPLKEIPGLVVEVTR